MTPLQKIEISYKTIVFTAVFILFLWLLFQIRDILLLLFISFILMSALKPMVERLEYARLPRILAIFLLYILLILIVVLVTSTVAPLLITQSIHLANLLPGYTTTLLSVLNINGIKIDAWTRELVPLTQNVFGISVGIFTNIFSNIFSTLTVLVITFYLLLERKHLGYYLKRLTGDVMGEKNLVIIQKIEDRLGAWVRGQIILMVTIGVASYIGLLVLGVEFALSLALLAGILEIVPIVGPIISAVPAIIVALATAQTPALAILVIGLYILIQQLENNLIVPTVMRRAVGMPPVVTLIALMIGSTLGGMVGALLAIPAVVTLHVIVTEISALKR